MFKLYSIFKIILIPILFLFAMFPLFSFTVKAEEKIYLIEIKYDKGNISFGNVSTKLGYASEPEKPDFMEKDKYWIKLNSFSEKDLEKRMFSIPLEIFQEPPLEGDVTSRNGLITLEQTEYLMALPYYDSGKTLSLYDDKMNFVVQKDISFLANPCGNGICEKNETYKNCGKDCAKPVKEKTSYIFYFIIGIAVLILLVFVVRHIILSRNQDDY